MATFLVPTGVNLLLVFLFILSSAGTGLFILRRMGLSPCRDDERLLIAFALGSGTAGYAIFGLASLQLLSAPALWSLAAALSACGAVGWFGSRDISWRRVLPPASSSAEKVSAALLFLLLGAALLLALVPETGKDALLYHLAVPKLYLKQGGFYFIPGNTFANYPFHTEMLFLLGLFLRGDILAKLMAFAAVPFLLVGMIHFARHKMEQNSFPWLSLLIFFSIPSMFQLSHMSYIDLYIAVYAMAGLLSFLNWRSEGKWQWIFLSGVFAGLAISCKYSTLLYPALGFLGILVTYRVKEEQKGLLRDLSLFLAAAVLFGSPFYVKNWIMTGNPLYPFMYGAFGGRDWDPDKARLFDMLFTYMGMGRSFMDFVLLPWNLSVHARMDSYLFDGIVGPIFLIVLPFLAGLRNLGSALRVILLFCLLNFMFWASSCQNIRYLSPLLPFLSLTVGFVLSSYRSRRPLFLVVGAAVAGSLLFNLKPIIKEFREIRPLRYLTGSESRDEFLGRLLYPYPMYRHLNTAMPEETRVWLIYMKNWTFLCERDCYADAMYEHYSLQKILQNSSSASEVAARVREQGITHIMYDANYLTGEKSLLSPEEKALFEDFRRTQLVLEKDQGSFYLYRVKAGARAFTGSAPEGSVPVPVPASPFPAAG